MTRSALLAIALTLGGSTAAFAAQSLTEREQFTIARTVTPDSIYPSQPGPYTVIYHEWSDLQG